MSLDRAMKPLIAFVLLCAPVFGADSGVKVVSTTKNNPETGSTDTEDVFTRDGKTNLVRGTLTKAGKLEIRTHRFYHDGSLVGVFTAIPNERTAIAIIAGVIAIVVIAAIYAAWPRKRK